MSIYNNYLNDLNSLKSPFTPPSPNGCYDTWITKAYDGETFINYAANLDMQESELLPQQPKSVYTNPLIQNIFDEVFSDVFNVNKNTPILPKPAVQIPASPSKIFKIEKLGYLLDEIKMISKDMRNSTFRKNFPDLEKIIEVFKSMPNTTQSVFFNELQNKRLKIKFYSSKTMLRMLKCFYHYTTDKYFTTKECKFPTLKEARNALHNQPEEQRYLDLIISHFYEKKLIFSDSQ